MSGQRQSEILKFKFRMAEYDRTVFITKSHLKGGDEGNNGSLPPFRELLGSVGGAQYTFSSVERGRGRAYSAEYSILTTATMLTLPFSEVTAAETDKGETDCRSSVDTRSGGSAAEGQGGEQNSTALCRLRRLWGHS